ncbi:unnamed protein product [Mesocestoides corti]|uniref:Histone domain-containing protein n=1 Tax=Mesocestoides corti TaxID=53468 RepID=A0A0R3UCC6_MESCO|nr:unnamed protein product [Mesocestoides corti]
MEGSVALRFQPKITSTPVSCRRASFARAVRSIAERTRIESALTLRWQASALDCLQEAVEGFLVDLFSNVAMAAAHANHVTVKLVDLHLFCRFTHFLQ